MGGVTGRSPERDRDEGLAKPATWLVSEMSFVIIFIINYVTHMVSSEWRSSHNVYSEIYRQLRVLQLAPALPDGDRSDLGRIVEVIVEEDLKDSWETCLFHEVQLLRHQIAMALLLGDLKQVLRVQ